MRVGTYVGVSSLTQRAGRLQPTCSGVKSARRAVQQLLASAAAVKHQRSSRRLIQHGNTCLPLFNFQHPRDYKSTTFRRGTFYVYLVSTKSTFFRTSVTVSAPAAGLSSRSRLRGTQEARVYTMRKFGPQPRSGRSKSLDLASNHGITSRLTKPSKVMETLIFFSLFLSLCCCISHKYHTSPQNVYALMQPRYSSSRASSFSLCDSR